MANATADTPLVDKMRMAQLLGWSRPALDRRIDSDPEFPVVKRGRGHRDPWQFDPRAVIAHVQGEAGPQAALFSGPDRAVIDDRTEHAIAEAARLSAPKVVPPVQKPAAKIVHLGEASAAQKLKAVQAEQQLDKLRTSRGQLVEASAVADLVAGFCVSLGRALDALGERIAREAGLDAEQAEEVRTLIDDARRTAVSEHLARLLPEVAAE